MTQWNRRLEILELSWKTFCKRCCFKNKINITLPIHASYWLLTVYSDQQSEQLRTSHQEHVSYPEEWLNPITKSLDIMRWLKVHAEIKSSLHEEFDFDSAEVIVLWMLVLALGHLCLVLKVDLVSVVPARSPSVEPSEEERKDLFTRQKLDPVSFIFANLFFFLLSYSASHSH